MPLHILWDSNVLRTPNLEAVDKAAQEFVKEYPRSSFPELEAHPAGELNAFQEWAWESHQVAVDWAFGIQTVADPNKDLSADQIVQNMIKFILEGISPVEEAPEVPAEYWERLQRTTERRITLAGYRIADLSSPLLTNLPHKESTLAGDFCGYRGQAPDEGVDLRLKKEVENEPYAT